MKKLLALLLVLTMAVSLFVGCGSDGDDKADSKSDSTSTTSTEKESDKEEDKDKEEDSKPAEDIVLTMTDIWDESQLPYDGLVDAISRFEADNPGVKIERDVVPSDAYLVQLPTLATAADLPDIIATNGSMSRLFAETGAMLSLQPYLDADSDWVAKVWPSAFTEHTLLGEPYAMGIGAGNYGYLRYNKELLEQVGYSEFPETLEEFHVLCDKLVEAGITPIGLGDKQLWPADSINFSSFVNNFVGNEWTEKIFAKTGDVSFNDPQFIDALAAFQELGTKGYFNDNFLSIGHSDSLGLYMNEKVAIRGFGDWEDVAIAEQSPEVAAKTGIAAWPYPSEGYMAQNSYESSSAWGFGIASNIDDEKLSYAVDFISHYICSDERSKISLEQKGTFTPYRVDIELDDSNLPITVAQRREFIQTATPCLNWDAILDASVKEIYQRGLQALLMGDMTPEELGKSMQDEYESMGG